MGIYLAFVVGWILGKTLNDPYFKEGSANNGVDIIEGIGLLPLKTKFNRKK